MITNNKLLLFCLILLFKIYANAQTSKLALKVYAGPSFTRSFIQHVNSRDGVFSLTDKEYPLRPRYNFGTEVSYNFEPTWAIAVDFGFQSKGYFATKYSVFQNGTLAGASESKTEIYLLQSTVSIDKIITLPKPDDRITINAGAFYGYQIFDLGGLFKRETYNDIGVSVGFGFLKRQLSYKIVLEKGLVDIDRDVSKSFETTVMILKIGYTFKFLK